MVEIHDGRLWWRVMVEDQACEWMRLKMAEAGFWTEDIGAGQNTEETCFLSCYLVARVGRPLAWPRTYSVERYDTRRAAVICF